MKKNIKFIGVGLIAVFVIFAFSRGISKVFADDSVTWTSQSDFTSNTNASTTATSVPGDVTLATKVGGYTDTTKEQFGLGGTKQQDGLSQSSVANTNGGEVTINQGYGLTPIMGTARIPLFAHPVG